MPLLPVHTRLSALLPLLARAFQSKAALRPVPAPTPRIQTPAAFLAALGRGADTKLQPASWAELWALDGPALKARGLAVSDRRYILWAMEKFRQGADPVAFAHPPRPKKTVRGWGAAVQDGKRIRSRRKR